MGETDVDGLADRGRGKVPPINRRVIDLHVHMVGMGDSGRGCRASKEFIASSTFAAMLASLRIAPFEVGDEKMRETILRAADTSKEVEFAVLLAMDGVYKNGNFIESESHLVVPNDCVIGMAKQSKRVLLGASVHPYRLTDKLIAETERCIGEGAALFTWWPAGQQINPADDRCIPFYVRLAREGIPLLCHSGTGLVMDLQDSKASTYNNPRRLIRALDIGVKTIVADCPSTQTGGYFEDLMQMLQEAETKRWEIFADISAYCTPLRISYMDRILREIEDGRISPKRFLYGSDFPWSAADINVFKRLLSIEEMLYDSTEQGNWLDNHFRIMKQFGIYESIFTNACDVLRL